MPLSVLPFYNFTCPTPAYFCAVRKKKQPVVLEGLAIADYAAEGKSLARQEGKVIFVEGAVPGDVVTVRLTKNKKDWAEGAVTAFQQFFG